MASVSIENTAYGVLRGAIVVVASVAAACASVSGRWVFVASRRFGLAARKRL